MLKKRLNNEKTHIFYLFRVSEILNRANRKRKTFLRKPGFNENIYL